MAVRLWLLLERPILSAVSRPLLSHHCFPCCLSHVRLASSAAKFDNSQPFVYYEILGVRRDAKQTEIKQAYFRLAKLYHPDVNQEESAREQFEQITEAYTTLIDLTQRYFYDQHGTACLELKQKGSHSTIFDWVPRFGLYEHQQRADGETSEVEDWFKAQGHVGYEERISLRQRLKNGWVELRYGLSYYNFPWKWHSFLAGLLAWCLAILLILKSYTTTLQTVSYRKPVPFYLKWENNDIYDILWYAGVRKNKSDPEERGGLSFPTNSRRMRPQSELARAGMHHMPKPDKPRKSEYSHTIYSNTRSRTKSKNIDRHKSRAEDKKIQSDWGQNLDLNKKNQKSKKKKKINDGFSV